jgi:hypothetical protein
MREPLLQAFPFPSTGIGDTAPHCQACMFIYSSCGRWVFPPLLCSFPSTATFTSFPALAYWGGAAAPACCHVYLQFTWEVHLPSSPVEFFSLLHSHKLPCSWLLGASPAPARGSPACLACLFTVLEGFPSPNLQRSGRPTLFPVCLNYSYCLLLIFSFFSPGGGQSVQGAMLLWPRLVCRSTTVPRSLPGLPSQWVPATGSPGGPPRFSV